MKIIFQLYLARLSLQFLILGAIITTPAHAQLVEKTTYTVTLQTTQKKIAEKRNTTSNPLEWKRKMRSLTKFDSKNSIEKIRESTKSNKFKIQASISGSYAGTDAAASTETEFESLVKTYYKETGEISEYKEIEETDDDSRTLAPNDFVTIYRNTTQGGGYEHSWETTEPIKDAEKKPVKVTIVVSRDLTPVFNQMLQSIIEDTKDIKTDSDEWGQFSKTCQDARTSKNGIRTYLNGVLKGGQNTRKLWTNGLDQNSWAEVIRAAQIASQKSNDVEALQVVLLGFYNVRQPSHNSWAWDHLKAIAGKYLSI